MFVWGSGYTDSLLGVGHTWESSASADTFCSKFNIHLFHLEWISSETCFVYMSLSCQIWKPVHMLTSTFWGRNFLGYKLVKQSFYIHDIRVKVFCELRVRVASASCEFELRVRVASCELKCGSCEFQFASSIQLILCELNIASCELLIFAS